MPKTNGSKPDLQAELALEEAPPADAKGRRKAAPTDQPGGEPPPPPQETATTAEILEAAADTEVPAAGKTAEAAEVAETAPPRPLQLVNSTEGCWKVMEDGTRIELSEEEWRSELARHFKRDGTPVI